MKRIASILVSVIAAGVLVIVATGASDEDPGSYRVRAIFDTAANIIEGEDVKVAGVKVGKIEAMEVTPEKKAAVVLSLTEPGFQDFRQDARCIVRPQSLIGEKFVECTPTRPGSDAPPLKKVPDGEDGAGQYLLPLENRFGGGTSSPVDVDLINNIMRLPYRQRLSIIINELGTGLAGNAQELSDVINRANPALRELDRVLQIVASQNDKLVQLAEDGDRSLAPLARDKKSVSDFIVRANEVAQATAERRKDLEANFERLPTFLREVQPTARRLAGFSSEAVPVFRSLRGNATDINAFIAELGPFSEAATPALRSLGDAGEIGGPALVQSRPVIQLLNRLGRRLRPQAGNLASLLLSFRKTGGVERAMDYIFLQMQAINGYDRFGHYLRAALLTNDNLAICQAYAAPDPTPGCESKFGNAATAAGASSASSASASAAPASPQDEDTTTPIEAFDRNGTPAQGRSGTSPPAGKDELALPSLPLPDNSAPAEPSSAGAPAEQAARSGVLDYLMGGDR